MRERRFELGLACVATASIALAGVGGALAPLQRPVADAALALAARRPPPLPAAFPDVAVVAIDPQSLRALPAWPWPRRFYADAVARLDAAGALAIAFDVDFSTPRDPTDDAALARALASSGRVVLASFRQFQRLEGAGELEIASLPIPALASGAAAIGSVMVPLEADGVVRRSPRAIDVAGTRTRTLAEAALDVATAAAGESATGRRDGSFAIDFRRSRPAFPVLSIADVIEGRFDPSRVAGRVVLVGATAAELQDLWATPLDPATPGVFIQALTYRTLSAERAGAPVLRRAGAGAEITLVALLALAASRLGRRSHGRRVARLAALAAATAAGCGVLLLQTGWLLDPVAPCAAVGLQYVLGLEAVRRRFGRQVAEQEHSLAAVFRLGEASTRATRDGGLELGLNLLGEVVGARGVALYRARPDGLLDGRCLSWGTGPGAGVGDLELAGEVLAGGEPRVFEGRIPGRGAGGVAVYAPLRAGALPVGVLVVEREDANTLDPVQLRTVATVGTQLALSAANLRLVEELRQSFETSVEAIASAIEARDGYTELHCRRLAIFSCSMASRLGLSEQETEAIRLGALLHDVGKIGIRDEILLKPGRFSPEERSVMQSHTVVGERIVQPIAGITGTTLGCVRHHHERWDGRGYPDGLAGESIPLGARIVSVVDVWDALSTARPYKPAYPQERVRELLHKGRGTEFDPEIVELFLAVLDEEGEEMLALAGGGPEVPA